MNRFARHSATIALAVLTASGAPSAGQRQDGPLSGSVVTGLDQLPGSPVTYRLYAETRELAFGYNLVNESSTTALRIDQEAWQGSFGLIAQRDGAEIPVTVRWSEDVRLGEDAKHMFVPRGLPIVLEPRQVAVWPIAIGRADGELFTAGRYVFTLGTVNARAAVRTSDGEPWNGLIPERLGQLVFVVAPPTSAAERARMHEIAADGANVRGDASEALAAYHRQLDVDPTNLRAKEMIGHMNLRLGRYREAIVWFEQVVVAGRSGQTTLLRILASAYVGAGDEASAIRVLRTAGISQANIRAEIENAKRHLRDRR